MSQDQITSEEHSLASADTAFKVEQDIKSLKSQIQGSYLEMGRLLREVRDNKHYIFLGFDTVTEWLSSPDISISPSWAWKAIGLYETFIINLGKKPEEIEAIDYTKLNSIVSIVRKHPEQADEWIDKASTLRRIDLQIEIKSKHIADRVEKIESLHDIELVEGVFCGDPIEEMKKLGENSVDLVVSAPDPETPPFILQELFSELRRVLKQNGSVFLFADHHNLVNITTAMHMNDYHLIRDIVVAYNESKQSVGVNTLHPMHDLVLWASRGDKTVYNFTEVERDIWYEPLPIDPEHPMEKPMDAILQLIKMSSDEGQVVLDPFMGNGNIVLAAKTLGRKFVGIEKDELWYKLTLEKLKNA